MPFYADPLTVAHRNFSAAAVDLLTAWEQHPDAPDSTLYPFAESFAELVPRILDWRSAVAEYLGDAPGDGGSTQNLLGAGTPGPRPEIARPATAPTLPQAPGPAELDRTAPAAEAEIRYGDRTATYRAWEGSGDAWNHAWLEITTATGTEGELIEGGATVAVHRAISHRWGL